MKFRIQTLLLVIALIAVSLAWVIDARNRRENLKRATELASTVAAASTSAHVYDLVDNSSGANLQLAREVGLLCHFIALARKENDKKLLDRPTTFEENSAFVLQKLGVRNLEQLTSLLGKHHEHLAETDVFTTDGSPKTDFLRFAEQILSN